ncbi:MAG: hypothetical protein J0H98_10970 [Solirubrobacterales bacterium]|nr:hypothetical protein [Solirubrobacterales bacterium]
MRVPSLARLALLIGFAAAIVPMPASAATPSALVPYSTATQTLRLTRSGLRGRVSATVPTDSTPGSVTATRVSGRTVTVRYKPYVDPSLDQDEALAVRNSPQSFVIGVSPGAFKPLRLAQARRLRITVRGGYALPNLSWSSRWFSANYRTKRFRAKLP